MDHESRLADGTQPSALHATKARSRCYEHRLPIPGIFCGVPMYQSTRFFSLASVLLIVALTGCGKQLSQTASRTPNDTTANAAEKAAENGARCLTSPEASLDKKHKTYEDIYFSVKGFLPDDTFAERAARDRDKPRKGNFRAIRNDTFRFDDPFVRQIKAAVAAQPSMPAADAAAQNLLEVVEKYLPNWKKLDDYNKSKGFEHDNGAEGRRMLPMYREGDEKLLAAVSQFEEAFEDLLRVQLAKRTMLEFHASEALGYAEALVSIFKSKNDFNNKANITRANNLVLYVEADLAKLQAEHAKQKAESPDSLPTYDYYESIHSALTSVVGKYRESRTNPELFEGASHDLLYAHHKFQQMTR